MIDQTLETFPVAAAESPFQIIERISRARGLTPSQTLSPARSRWLVLTRQTILIEIRRQYPEMSFQDLARCLGRTDHTYALYAIRCAERRLMDEAAKEQARLEAAVKAKPQRRVLRRSGKRRKRS